MTRNRAKCKLCNDIIECFGPNDYVTCKCTEITIGPNLFARTSDWHNFLRVDDDEHEIEVTYKDKQQEQNAEVNEKEDLHDSKPGKEQLLRELDEMIKSYDHLPKHAMLAPATHADQLSLLMLVSSLVRSIS